MKRWFMGIVATIACTLTLPAAAQQQRPQLTIDWAYSRDAQRVAQVSRLQWLADGTAIMYDSRKPEAQRKDRDIGASGHLVIGKPTQTPNFSKRLSEQSVESQVDHAWIPGAMGAANCIRSVVDIRNRVIAVIG